MARPMIYVTTNEIPEAAVGILEAVGDVVIKPDDGPPSRETLLNEASEADGIFCLLTEQIDAELMRRAKKLKIVANMAVGYDNVDVKEATRRGILVTNTPGVLTETVGDLTFGLMIAVARRIVEADRYTRAGKWIIPWSPKMMVGEDLHEKTLGIYGLGRIGAAVARRAKGFDMKLAYYNRTKKELPEGLGKAEYMELDQLLRESDFFSVHVPLSPSTRHSIGAREIALMKRTAYIINTSRGQIIDQEALTRALSEKRIAGAALDVFEGEPINPNHPLLKLDNVVVTPHIGSASVETRGAMARMAAQNICAALKGEVPPNVVNREAIGGKG